MFQALSELDLAPSTYAIVAGVVGVVLLTFLRRKPAGAKYTSKQVVHMWGEGRYLRGKTAIVTGGNSGIGLETVKALAYAGCRVVLCSRSVKAGLEAIENEVKKSGEGGYIVGDGEIVVKELDLSSLASVKAFAENFLATEKRIDFLILNAGTMAEKTLRRTKDGFENQIGVNHFGHAYLVSLLEKLMLAQTFACRVVVLASSAHTFGKIDFNDLHYEFGRKYSAWEAYGSSKLANILHAKWLADDYKNTKIVACSVHPGIIQTALWRNTRINKDSMINSLISWLSSMFLMDKTIPQGAATTLWACLSEDGDKLRGQYLLDCAVGKPSPAGQDKDKSLRLALKAKTIAQLEEKTRKL